MSDLSTLNEPLKRELAVPGEFETLFPNTSETDLSDSLTDGFAEAQLDGYFTDYTVDLDTYATTPDISAAAGSLVILYAGMRIIRARLRALNLQEKYEAGPVSYEIARSSTVLREELKYLIKRKEDLIGMASQSAGSTVVYDAYFTRSAVNWSTVGGLLPAELG